MPEPTIEEVEFVLGHEFESGPVGLVAGEAFEAHDAPHGDTVEGETLAQVVSGVEAAVLNAEADLEEAEEFLDGPARPVRVDAAAGVVEVGGAVGTEQDPVQRGMDRGLMGFVDGDGDQGQRGLAGLAWGGRSWTVLARRSRRVLRCARRGVRPQAATVRLREPRTGCCARRSHRLAVPVAMRKRRWRGLAASGRSRARRGTRRAG